MLAITIDLGCKEANSSHTQDTSLLGSTGLSVLSLRSLEYGMNE